MNYKISKELFEAVMGFCKNEISEIYVSGKNIFWHTYEDEFARNKDSKINIDSLYFKCKEWAYNQGYIIYSSTKSCSMFKKEAQLYCSNENIQEQQKIFDACQWVLDNKEK